MKIVYVKSLPYNANQENRQVQAFTQHLATSE